MYRNNYTYPQRTSERFHFPFMEERKHSALKVCDLCRLSSETAIQAYKATGNKSTKIDFSDLFFCFLSSIYHLNTNGKVLLFFYHVQFYCCKKTLWPQKHSFSNWWKQIHRSTVLETVASSQSLAPIFLILGRNSISRLSPGSCLSQNLPLRKPTKWWPLPR